MKEVPMKRVLITGASSGIGAATAIKFAREGYEVLLTCDRNREGLRQTADTIRSTGGLCREYMCDVASDASVEALFTELRDSHMPPSIVINNAGISLVGLLQDLRPEEWDRIQSINLGSVYRVCHAAIPSMVERGEGRILNVSSMWGNVGASCEVAYSATKGGVNTFTKALAKELAPSGIAVNAVAFGCVDTAMNGHLNASEKETLAADIPCGYFLSAEDAADILYTVSCFHPYVTGQIITADGGYT